MPHHRCTSTRPSHLPRYPRPTHQPRLHCHPTAPSHVPTLVRRTPATIAASLRTQGDTDTIGSGQRTVRVLYYRRDQNYQGWVRLAIHYEACSQCCCAQGLHVAGDPSIETDWQRPLPSSPADDGWVCWDLALPESGRHVELIVHRGLGEGWRAVGTLLCACM